MAGARGLGCGAGGGGEVRNLGVRSVADGKGGIPRKGEDGCMKRDTSLDALKFAMIYLVVLVHLGFKDFGLGVARMVDAFHMPVFVFLSGYFTSQNTDKAKQVRWFKHTLLLYLVAQFAHVLLGLALRWFQAALDGATFQAGPWCSWKTPVYPQFALWYLVCLVYWRLAAWRFFRNANDALLIFGSVTLALVSGFVPVDRAWSFQRAFAFCPYFFLGMIFRKRGWLAALGRVPFFWAAVVCAGGLLAARCLPTYMPKVHYATWHDFACRAVQTGLGTVLCLSILRMSRQCQAKWLAAFGMYTLWIYVGHTYLVRVGYKVFPALGIQLNLITAPLLAGIYCAFFILLAKLWQWCKEKAAPGSADTP